MGDICHYVIVRARQAQAPAQACKIRLVGYCQQSATGVGCGRKRAAG